MRENMGLYRGKRTKNGDWVEGPLLFVENEPAIFDINDPERTATWSYGEARLWGALSVIPETVGQYTGKIDMKGIRIFEDDICRFHNDDGESTDSLVCWDETESQWQIRCVDHGGKDVLDSFYAERCEVIGNYHDMLTKNSAIDSPSDNP